MQRIPTRRTLLAALGAAGTVSFAGCSSLLGDSDSSPSTSTSTKGNGSGSQTTSSTTTKNDTKTVGNRKTNESTPGQSVDDFEGDVGSRWGVSNGKYSVTKQDAFQGSQSLVLQPKKNAKQPVSKVFQSFYPKTLDLSTHDLSIVAKVNKPKAVKVSAEILAPGESSMLTATRYIPQELNGWVRFDLGYTGKTGKPAMDKVSQVNLQIGPLTKDKNFQVLIDDLRKIPKPKKGKVMFQFDDGHISTYKKAYPVLKEKGWPGAVAVIPDSVNSNNRITDQMMREMGNAGWDMMGHAGELLPKLPKQKQRRILQQANQNLKLKGFKKGARHFVAPYSRVDKTTLSLIDEIYETGFLYGACPNNAQHPSNPSFIARVQGPSVRGARQAIDVADVSNQLVVISYHALGDGNNATPMNRFEEIVNYVGKKDMDIITPSQFVDGKQW